MPPQSDIQHAAQALADTFLAGEFAPHPMAERAAKHFLKPWRGLEALTELLAETFSAFTRPARRSLISAIAKNEPLGDWLSMGGTEKFNPDIGSKPKMCAAKGNPESWQLPQITTPVALARWLHLSESELLWFARPWRQAPDRLQHYRHHWIAKRRGGHRLIEKPKDALKLIQQKILHQILDYIPPHNAVHSYRARRNVISYAEPHCAKPLLLRLDVADFFPSLQINRVRALFRTAGYPDAVANPLADLCCQSTPASILAEPPNPLGWHLKKLLQSPHLPQGAPTSPALSNLLGYRLDCRLAGLAKSIGASYTRYADDLAVSGDHHIANLAPIIGAILIEEGFTPNHRKTRLQRKSQRQRLAGTIVNSHAPNIERRDYDSLKATLHNCAHRNPAAEDWQNIGSETFRLQLQGKIAWIQSLNPNKAKKLQQLFDRIRW